MGISWRRASTRGRVSETIVGSRGAEKANIGYRVWTRVWRVLLWVMRWAVRLLVDVVYRCVAASRLV